MDQLGPATTAGRMVLEALANGALTRLGLVGRVQRPVTTIWSQLLHLMKRGLVVTQEPISLVTNAAEKAARGGRRPKYYRLTPLGKKALEAPRPKAPERTTDDEAGRARESREILAVIVPEHLARQRLMGLTDEQIREANECFRAGHGLDAGLEDVA